MRKKINTYLIYTFIYTFIASNSALGLPKVVPLYQGASTLLGQRTCRFSEAANSPQKAKQLVKGFQKACAVKGDVPPLRLEANGRQYQCVNPVQSSASLYVAHYSPFLEKVQTNGLKAFGFIGKIADEKKCPFVSFSKSINTAVKYSFGVTDPNWENFNGEFPYYENGSPSVSTVGSLMIALPQKIDMEQQKGILHIDVENEPLMILGRTKIRRLEQKEICIIAGIPTNITTLNIPISMPDFSTEWSCSGTDDQLRKVNPFGFTEREYGLRKKKIENADDTSKSWRSNYEKTCKWQERSMEYVVKHTIEKQSKENYEVVERFTYNSIFN